MPLAGDLHCRITNPRCTKIIQKTSLGGRVVLDIWLTQSQSLRYLKNKITKNNSVLVTFKKLALFIYFRFDDFIMNEIKSFITYDPNDAEKNSATRRKNRSLPGIKNLSNITHLDHPLFPTTHSTVIAHTDDHNSHTLNNKQNSSK